MGSRPTNPQRWRCQGVETISRHTRYAMVSSIEYHIDRECSLIQRLEPMYAHAPCTRDGVLPLCSPRPRAPPCGLAAAAHVVRQHRAPRGRQGRVRGLERRAAASECRVRAEQHHAHQAAPPVADLAEERGAVGALDVHVLPQRLERRRRRPLLRGCRRGGWLGVRIRRPGCDGRPHRRRARHHRPRRGRTPGAAATNSLQPLAGASALAAPPPPRRAAPRPATGAKAMPARKQCQREVDVCLGGAARARRGATRPGAAPH